MNVLLLNDFCECVVVVVLSGESICVVVVWFGVVVLLVVKWL